MNLLLTLLLSFCQAKTSSASFTVVGVVKPIVLLKVTQITPILYNAEVTSNNPQGFSLAVSHDGVIRPEDETITVASQTEGGIFNFKIRFIKPPTQVSVAITAD